jgi:hypothetical protein
MRYNSAIIGTSAVQGAPVRTENPRRFDTGLPGALKPLVRPTFLAAVVVLLHATTVAAQVDTLTQEVSLGQTLTDLTRFMTVPGVGEAIRINTAIEVSSAPLGTSSGGFAFELDKTTGLEVRKASTFGPSFAERVITAGTGQLSLAVNLTAASYDKLNFYDLDRMELVHQIATNPAEDQKGFMSLVLSSETTVIQGVMGATDNLDIGVAVPIVRIRLEAISWVEDATGRVLLRGTGIGTSTGLGDIAIIGKFRLLKFGGAPPPDAPVEPDPGGLAIQVVSRLPTGSRDQMRGLGIYRTLGSLIFSAGKGKVRPHAQIGYEWWSKGVDVISDFDPTVTARHSFQWAAGAEIEAAPKLTLMVDFLSRQINGGGKVEKNFLPASALINPGATVTGLDYALAIDEGILKQSLIPGLKWNLMGKFLLSLNGIIALKDSGLHDKFTPVVGLDFTF